MLSEGVCHVVNPQGLDIGEQALSETAKAGLSATLDEAESLEVGIRTDQLTLSYLKEGDSRFYGRIWKAGN
ncbi:MAG: hypothetical protein BRC46_16370 [Cyanobacteria bacterium QS_6_48_18]|nr:MAG: hypothetical protein BRC46_16370 [Cyanobacteria bacterium QS_6_48_18]